MTKKTVLPWIYQLRAIAIFAVVICHQQNLLHTSEWVQIVTIYSVSMLIFLAGCTQFLSLKRRQIDFQKSSILFYNLKKLMPVILAYILASMSYIIYNGLWDGTDFNVLISYLLNFSASAPFYFIKYYCTLTMCSPILIAIVNYIYTVNKKCRWILLVLFIFGTFALGYFFIFRANFFGGSYLCVYTLGILYAKSDFKVITKNFVGQFVLGLVLLLVGFYYTQQFYWGIVVGTVKLTRIDEITPKLMINPPNVSIIAYSLGLTLVLATLFQKMDRYNERKFAGAGLRFLAMIGKYSLDIFLWHLLVRTILSNTVVFHNAGVRLIVTYACMIFLPIICRVGYEKMKIFVKNNV